MIRPALSILTVMPLIMACTIRNVNRIDAYARILSVATEIAEVPTRFGRASKSIGDKAYDSDPLDQRIREHLRVELIAPHRWNRSKPVTQDGRALRRYRRRWKIERLFAWLHNYRRIVIRWEYYPENFLGMAQLACAVILLRHYEMSSPESLISCILFVPCAARVREANRPMLLRIASALLVHTKGLGCSLCTSMNSKMADSSSRTL